MTEDFVATINQSMANKLVDSVTYPFIVFEHRKTFSGFSALDQAVDIFEDEILIDTKLLANDAMQTLKATYGRRRSVDQASEDIGAQVGEDFEETLSVYENCLKSFDEVEAHNQANPNRKLTWDGPSKTELKSIIASLKKFGEYSLKDFTQIKKIVEFKVFVSWIRIAVSKPSFTLSGSSFQLNVPDVLPSGTGEVWAKYKWIKCIKRKWGICYRWKIVTKSKRILKVTLKDIKTELSVVAEIMVSGPLVRVFANVIKLRLKYKYLDKIPLEKLANKKLSDKPVIAFDASKFVATMPMLGSKFRVQKIAVPSATGKINVLVTATAK